MGHISISRKLTMSHLRKEMAIWSQGISIAQGTERLEPLIKLSNAINDMVLNLKDIIRFS